MSDDRRAREERIKNAADEALRDAKIPAAARQGLAFLFPKAEEVLKTYIRAGSTDLPHRLRQRRISVEDYAPAYFRMDPQRATWGRSEIEKILGQDDPSAGLKYVEEQLQAATEPDRPRLRRLFLEQLEAFFRGQPITEPWLHALVNASPGYIAAGDPTSRFLFVKDNSDRLRRIVYQGLRPLQAEARTSLMKHVISAAYDISLLCDIVRLIAGDIRPNTRERDQQIEVTFGEGTENVREVLLARVREVALKGDVWRQARPDRIFWFWWGSVTGNEVTKFTNEALETGIGLRYLLEIPIQLVRSTSGDYEHVAPYWSGIVDIDRLAEIATAWLNDVNTSDDDRQRARRYLAAFERRERI